MKEAAYFYFVSLITIIAIGVMLLPGARPAGAAPAGNPLTIETLTDPAEPARGVDDIRVVPGAVGVHVAWAADLSELGDNSTDYDVYYYNTGDGVTRLSNRAVTTATNFFDAPYVQLALDTQQRAHIAWAEPTPGELSDVFYWRTGFAEPLHLSPTADTAGNVNRLYLVLDDEDRPHLVWAEGDAMGADYNFYYWNESVGLTKIPGTGGMASSIVYPYPPYIDGNVLHLLYRDAGDGYEIYYWNSATNASLPLRGTVTGTMEAGVIYAGLNSDGDFEAVWLDVAGTRDLYFWSAGAAESVLLTDHSTFSSPQRDSAGNLHMAFGDGSTLYHFDSTQQNTTFIASDLESPLMGANGAAPGSSHFAFTRTENGDTDFYYWNSATAVSTTISIDDAGTDQLNGFQLGVNSQDHFFAGWGEDGVTYFYDTATDATRTISSRWKLIDSSAYGQKTMVETEGTMLWLLEATDISDSHSHAIYDADTGTLTPVPRTGTPTQLEDASLVVDAVGRVHVFWRQVDQGAILADYYYWRSASGSQHLSSLLGTDYPARPQQPVVDAAGGVYAVWNQYDDTLGDTLFIAYEMPNLEPAAYLPLIRGE